MALTNQQIKSIVAELDLISAEDLNKALAQAEEQHQSLDRMLVSLDLITDDEIGRVLADSFGCDFVDLDKVAIDDAVLRIIPEVVARKQKAIAYDRAADGIKVALVNPRDLAFIELLEKKTGEKIIPYYTTSTNIDNALAKYQKGIANEFSDVIGEHVAAAQRGAKAEDVPVIRIVDTLIQYAQENKSSDVHIEPTEEKTLVRFRIDGILHDIVQLPKSLHDVVVTRIKILSKLRTDEHQSAQDGKFQAVVNQEKLDVRVSILPIVEGEKVVMRLLSSKSRQFGLEDLGFATEDLVKIKQQYTKPYGMILATGPTGCGKTTTMYAILKLLNRREVNISTIEDPVEYDIDGVNQIQVNARTNLTFAAGLKSILRQDPDIIMVGEIRDAETAGIAVNAAMTGHLVLSTLHTNDAATTLPRFLDMKIAPFLVASTVNVIVAQRLVRKNCSRCIGSKEVLIAELQKHWSAEILAKLVPAKKKGIRLYAGTGCKVCGMTGYTGRIGVYEVLVVSEKIRELIMSHADADEIRKQAIVEGMTTMVEDGIRKVLSGATTIAEVLRVTRES